MAPSLTEGSSQSLSLELQPNESNPITDIHSHFTTAEMKTLHLRLDPAPAQPDGADVLLSVFVQVEREC